MEKKTTIHRQLTAYSALAVAMLAAPKVTDAQVVYTDIQPDTTFSGTEYDLDVNNDGTPDFTFGNYITSGWQSVYINPAANSFNAFINKPPSTGVFFNSPDTLKAGDPIDASKNWKVRAVGTNVYFALGYASSGTTRGNWINGHEAYIGLRFKAGASTYYGWARVQINSLCTQVTIKDYAYFNSADQPINAGDKGLSAAPVLHNSPTLFTLQQQAGALTLNLHTNNATVQVVNALGQTILTETTTQHRWQLNTTTLPAGIYFLRVEAAGSLQTTRFVVGG